MRSLLFDDDMPCTVASPDGASCPAGSVTVEATGRAFVMVGAYGGPGCTPEDSTPIQLVVGRNGDDVELTDAFVGEGDLLEVIP